MKPRLSLFDASSLVIGATIGAGIFVAPNLVAREVPYTPVILLAWFIGGLLALFGALAAAELGSLIPGNGGMYRYLKAAYGPLWGFLSGWTTFLILYSGALAWMAVSFTIYLREFIPLSEWEARFTGSLLLLFFAWINARGLRPAANTQDALTVLKILGILALAGAAVAAYQTPETLTIGGQISPAPFGAALIGCLLTYDGWVLLSFITGEVHDAGRNVPRALLLGMGGVMLLYLLANGAYLSVMTPQEVGAAERVGAEAARRLMGAPGAAFVSIVTLLSVAGAMNGILLATSRLYQQMARDGLFFSSLAADHPRFGTPARALWAKAGWSVLLVLTGTYSTLGSFAMFAGYLFYMLLAVAVIVLRERRPDSPRPYRMWGYPFTPLLFAITALAFVINTLTATPGPALAALGLIALGLPAYWFWTRHGSSASLSR